MNDQAQRLRDLVRDRTFPVKCTGRVAASGDTGRFPGCVAVTSGKGGVGKSNIALLIASSLGSAGKRVLLLDADLGLANVHIILGIAPRKTLADVVDGTATLESIITSTDSGFDLIPGASGIEKLANLECGKFLALRNDFMLLEKRYDELIIDTGAGIGSVVTGFVLAADVAIVVMTPEPTSLADAYAMVKVLSERNAQRIGIVVNMVRSDREGVETFDRLNALVVKFLRRSVEHCGTLPYYKAVAEAVRMQRFRALVKENSILAQRIQMVSKRLCGVKVQKKAGFFESLLGKENIVNNGCEGI